MDLFANIDSHLRRKIICKKRYLSSKFTWHNGSKTFSADASDLSHYDTDPFGKLFDKGNEDGFIIVSAKTGKGIPFKIIKEDKDENDVLSWHLIPALPEDSRLNIKVIVYND